jgi:hypothetical protein
MKLLCVLLLASFAWGQGQLLLCTNHGYLVPCRDVDLSASLPKWYMCTVQERDWLLEPYPSDRLPDCLDIIIPIVTRHPTLPLPEPTILWTLSPIGEQCLRLSDSTWLPCPEPAAVPAIQKTDKDITCRDISGYLLTCIYDSHWVCTDTSRVLLTSVDGKSAWCVKF